MKTIRLILAILICALGYPAFSQVFPGDANNNGRVSNSDILYIGRAFGNFGPSRINAGTEFEAQTISLPWSSSFPDGLNFIYADANGNGLVEFTDFLTVFFNYDKEQAEVIPEDFQAGFPGADPGFSFDINAIPGNLTEGAVISVPIQLGDALLPLMDCNGISFTIEYDSEIIQAVEFNLGTSFLNADQGLFPFQYEYETGELDVALTRYGLDPVNGWGEIGVLSMIIEDNLIDFLPADIDSIGVLIRIKDIMVLDTNLNQIPIVGDSIELMVYHPNALVGNTEPPYSEGVKVFPNPSQDKVTISAPTTIQQVDITDLRGIKLATVEGNGRKQMQLNTANIPGSLLLLQIFTQQGSITRKLYKQAKE